MPDREFIHSLEGVRDGLRFALSVGLQIISDVPQIKAAPAYLTNSDVGDISRGVFLLFKQDWVAGPLQMMRIDGGVNVGRYFIKPNSNFAAITVYFQGEEKRDGQRRLGSGQLWYRPDWLDDRIMQLRPSPPEMKEYYTRLCKFLISREYVKAGVHRYWLCNHVVDLVRSESTIPPFEFIPWPPPLSTAIRRSKR